MAAVLAAQAGAPAPAHAACTLTLIVTPCIELSVPASYGWGSLAPGTHVSAQQAVQVSSNQGWGMRVKADRADGRAAEWNGSGYVAGGRQLTAAMQFARTSLDGTPHAPAWTALSGSDQTVISGQPHTGCIVGLACSTATVGVSYRQAVSYADRRADPNAYRLRVTYTATHGW